jgi:hypothetical protein
MSLEGTVQNGVVVLDPGSPPLADDTRVERRHLHSPRSTWAIGRNRAPDEPLPGPAPAKTLGHLLIC